MMQFGAFSLDVEGYVLSKNSKTISIEPQAFNLLCYLIENRERVISKEELIEHIWGGRIVSDAAIASAINLVRRGVDDDGKKQAVIKTIPRVGFRFVAKVDDTITASSNMRLSAIISANLADYPGLIEKDPDGAVEAWRNLRHEVLNPSINKFSGRILKLTGAGFLAEFPKVEDAVRCAINIQEGASARQLTFRIGIDLGDVIEDGANANAELIIIAAHLESLAAAGGISISGSVHDEVRNQVDCTFEDIGEHQVKNILVPVKVYRIIMNARATENIGASNKLTTSKPSIAVLPFKNLTGDPDQDFLSNGMQFEIQNALVKVSGLFLVALNNSNIYQGKSATEATDGLSVRYAFEGGVRRSGNRVRVSVTLTDGALGEIVLAEQFDHELEDAFELFDDITRRILTALHVKLIAGEQARVWHKRLPDLRSLESFYHGVFDFFNMVDQTSLMNARRHFEEVHRLHPESSIGATWIALTHWYQFQRGWTDSRIESKRLSKEWAEKGATLPDSDGQAMTVLCHIHILDRNFDSALSIGRENLEVRPTCLHSHAFYANALHFCGEHEKSLYHLDLAFRYAPVHPPIYKIFYASTCRATGDFDKASAASNAVLAGNPKDVTTRIIMASIAMKKNRPNEAHKLAEEILDLEPSFTLSGFAEGQPYRDQGFLAEYIAELREAGLPD